MHPSEDRSELPPLVTTDHGRNRFNARLVLDTINDRKDAKRKEAQEQRDIEYHNKRMNDFR